MYSVFLYGRICTPEITGPMLMKFGRQTQRDPYQYEIEGSIK